MSFSLLSSILLAFLNGSAALVTFGMDNPKGEYYEKVPEIKENRLADVSNALGPIVSDVHDFLEEGPNGSVEELSETEEAVIALTESITPADDLPDLREALELFYEPRKTYRRCRYSRDGCYYSFISGLVFAMLPPILNQTSLSASRIATISKFAFWAGVVVLSLGIVLFISFMYHRSKMDKMSENANFKLD